MGALRDLARRSKASWGYDESFLARFEDLLPRDLARPSRTTLLAEGDGGVEGFAVVDDLGDRAWLEDLWVEPACFRRGVGRRLYTAALAAARSLGRDVLEFESDSHAEPFYAAMGAVRFDTRASIVPGEGPLPLMRGHVAPE